jgi:hypothetical protein
LYAGHGPVLNIDPSGHFFTAVGSITVSGIQKGLGTLRVGSLLSAFDKAETFVDAVQLVSQFAATGTFNPALVAGLVASIVPFGNILSKGRIIGNKLDNVAGQFGEAFNALKANSGSIGRGLNSATQQLGDLGALAVGEKLGLQFVKDFPTKYHGIDGLAKIGDKWVIVEAKGGLGQLGKTKAGEQLSQAWIERKIAKLRSLDGDFKQYAKELNAARQSGNLDVLLVTTPTQGAGAFVPTFVQKNFNQLGPKTFNL